jgi:hypothetical protein
MGVTDRQTIRGQVRLILTDAASGEVVAERAVHNVIMTGGSALVARRFCGESVQPISAVGVGQDDSDPDDTSLRDLKAPVTAEDGNPERADISHLGEATSYVSTDDTAHSATVRFGATFEASKGNGALVEAGIFNDAQSGILYNRVTFPVINKTDTHEMTLIWEVIFAG